MALGIVHHGGAQRQERGNAAAISRAKHYLALHWARKQSPTLALVSGVGVRYFDRSKGGSGGVASAQRVYDGEEGEAVEARIARANPADAVLAHQHCGMHVVDEVAPDVWELPDGLCEDRLVAFGRA